MITSQILPNAGALITFALGLLGIVTPNIAAKLVSIEPIGLTGNRRAHQLNSFKDKPIVLNCSNNCK